MKTEAFVEMVYVIAHMVTRDVLVKNVSMRIAGFVHIHNSRNPGFSRTFFIQGYLKHTKEFPKTPRR